MLIIVSEDLQVLKYTKVEMDILSPSEKEAY